jgi:DNA repair protein RadA/Sms
MAKKNKISYLCSECGSDSPRWAGQCSSCGEWNTIVEFKESLVKTPTVSNRGYSVLDSGIEKLSSVSDEKLSRFKTGSTELDRVLGEGIVLGSIVLISGAPGAGKSTLLIGVLSQLSKLGAALYVSGEESKKQIKDRGDRLGLDLSNIDIMTTGDMELVTQVALKHHHKFLIVDSVQTCYLNSVDSAPGNVTQVKESAALLSRFSKENGVTTLLAVHETKDGANIAGPQTLSHIGDATLKLSRESDSKYRTLRALKNRFGSAEEVGTLAMMPTGLKDVTNPSAIFLEQSIEASGNIAYASSEGGRTLLINIQALVDSTSSEKPQRGVVGVDYRRLAMLLAVINKRMGIHIADQDIYINVVGGVKLNEETGSDLPMLLSILSSFKDKVFKSTTVAFGEVGLSGEIRPVPMGQERIKEAIRNGFDTIIVPKKNFSPSLKREGVNIIPVDKVGDLFQFIQ